MGNVVSDIVRLAFSRSPSEEFRLIQMGRREFCGGVPGTLDWKPRAKRLTLRLAPGAAPHFGEVAEARFKSLASSLSAEAQVVTR